MVEEMQTLKELQIEVEKDIQIDVVDDNYCIDIINKGNLLKGYGLYLAKEIVHKDSKSGWDDFCKTVGVSRPMANFSIEFYMAKTATIVAESLPEKEGVFRALTGETVEAKAEQYEKVKQVLHVEEPTAIEITTYKKLSHEMKKSPP